MKKLTAIFYRILTCLILYYSTINQNIYNMTYFLTMVNFLVLLGVLISDDKTSIEIIKKRSPFFHNCLFLFDLIISVLCFYLGYFILGGILFWSTLLIYAKIQHYLQGD